jgi:hypothetical protein
LGKIDKASEALRSAFVPRSVKTVPYFLPILAFGKQKVGGSNENQ